MGDATGAPPPSPPTGRPDQLRIGDAERERTATALRDHTAAGRLDPEELDERLGRAYAARTSGELGALTSDLPELPPDPSAPGPREPDPDRDLLKRHLLQRAGGGVAISVLCVAIWFATGADGHFWPLWVILGMLLTVVLPAWRGLGPGGDPRAELERRDCGGPHRGHRGGTQRLDQRVDRFGDRR